MLVQQYRLKLADKTGQAQVGQTVFQDNDSDEIIGFLSSIYQDGSEVHAVITLFQQRNIDLDSFGGVLLAAKLSAKEVNDALANAIRTTSPEIAQMWQIFIDTLKSSRT